MTLLNCPENKKMIFNHSFEKTITDPFDKAVSSRRRFSFGWLTLLLVLCCSILAAAQTDRTTVNSDWVGNYYFSETGPAARKRSRWDVVPSASYEITIQEKADKLMASFAANGVQLFEAYECSVVVVKDDTLEFYFQSLESVEVQNFRRFKKEDLLFRLSKSGSGKSTKYLFQPAAYKIVRLNPSKQKTPIYFEKPSV